SSKARAAAHSRWPSAFLLGLALPAFLLGLALPAFLLGLALPALLLGLALPACPVDRSAKDVAEAGAGIGCTEFRHRALLFVHLAGLDRQRQFARGTVDRGDLGIDLFADREAVGTLLAAVAR